MTYHTSPEQVCYEQIKIQWFDGREKIFSLHSLDESFGDFLYCHIFTASMKCPISQHVPSHFGYSNPHYHCVKNIYRPTKYEIKLRWERETKRESKFKKKIVSKSKPNEAKKKNRRCRIELRAKSNFKRNERGKLRQSIYCFWPYVIDCCSAGQSFTFLCMF